MVTIQNLHFAYRRQPALSGLDMTLSPGSIYGLLGRNGTGKSTLLRNIAGFLFPHSGKINVLGYEPRKRQPSFLQKVFLVPEDIQLPAIGLDQWLKYTAPFYGGFDRNAFEHYCREFEVPIVSRLTDMSYGQQKKVLISFALATNAELLLMDEPTNGLDIVSKNQFRKVIAGAIDDRKCFLISTHQVNDLEQLIDRVMVMDNGRIIFDQGVDTIAEKLLFKLSRDENEEAMAIYREFSLSGNALILPNYLQEESRTNLEMLYKAVNTDEKVINAYFK
jgi:ABC-2 type transport system ATP-binding protein